MYLLLSFTCSGANKYCGAMHFALWFSQFPHFLKWTQY